MPEQLVHHQENNEPHQQNLKTIYKGDFYENNRQSRSGRI